MEKNCFFFSLVTLLVPLANTFFSLPLYVGNPIWVDRLSVGCAMILYRIFSNAFFAFRVRKVCTLSNFSLCKNHLSC